MPVCRRMATRLVSLLIALVLCVAGRTTSAQPLTAAASRYSPTTISASIDSPSAAPSVVYASNRTVLPANVGAPILAALADADDNVYVLHADRLLRVAGSVAAVPMGTGVDDGVPPPRAGDAFGTSRDALGVLHWALPFASNASADRALAALVQSTPLLTEPVPLAPGNDAYGAPSVDEQRQWLAVASYAGPSANEQSLRVLSVRARTGVIVCDASFPFPPLGSAPTYTASTSALFDNVVEPRGDRYNATALVVTATAVSTTTLYVTLVESRLTIRDGMTGGHANASCALVARSAPLTVPPMSATDTDDPPFVIARGIALLTPDTPSGNGSSSGVPIAPDGTALVLSTRSTPVALLCVALPSMRVLWSVSGANISGSAAAQYNHGAADIVVLSDGTVVTVPWWPYAALYLASGFDPQTGAVKWRVPFDYQRDITPICYNCGLTWFGPVALVAGDPSGADSATSAYVYFFQDYGLVGRIEVNSTGAHMEFMGVAPSLADASTNWAFSARRGFANRQYVVTAPPHPWSFYDFQPSAGFLRLSDGLNMSVTAFPALPYLLSPQYFVAKDTNAWVFASRAGTPFMVQSVYGAVARMSMNTATPPPATAIVLFFVAAGFSCCVGCCVFSKACRSDASAAGAHVPGYKKLAGEAANTAQGMADAGALQPVWSQPLLTRIGTIVDVCGKVFSSSFSLFYTVFMVYHFFDALSGWERYHMIGMMTSEFILWLSTLLTCNFQLKGKADQLLVLFKVLVMVVQALGFCSLCGLLTEYFLTDDAHAARYPLVQAIRAFSVMWYLIPFAATNGREPDVAMSYFFVFALVFLGLSVSGFVYARQSTDAIARVVAPETILTGFWFVLSIVAKSMFVVLAIFKSAIKALIKRQLNEYVRLLTARLRLAQIGVLILVVNVWYRENGGSVGATPETDNLIQRMNRRYLEVVEDVEQRLAKMADILF